MQTLPDFSRARILVVGDVMLDRYWHGATQRISPEAPVPVVTLQDSEERPGGAANVALNLAHLGAQVKLLALVGKDDAANTLAELLTQAEIECELLATDLPTITKLRVICQHQQLLRVDFEKTYHQHAAQQPLLTAFEQQLANTDLVIFSDYGKGTLQQVSAMLLLAKARGVITLVDPKSNDFSVYAHAHFITPNFKEFTAVVGNVKDDEQLQQRARELIQQHHLQGLLVTRGSEGMSLVTATLYDHLPTKAREVFDVTGAGDTVVALLGLGLACQMSLHDAVAMANQGAGIVVGKLGTAFVHPEELRAALAPTASLQRGELSRDYLQALVKQAQRQGERIVFTNGCFDLLHPGHIDYLEAARALGQKLIVAVNDDASVQRLKGPTRPINPLADRIAMLNALQCVDWVIAFSEDTPAELIQQLNPDLLVKGGDYQIHQIAGSDWVLQHGGQVQVLPFKPGYSSSQLIEKIQRQH
jgi:D-beta-D-heptose 7-phosphate kinase/D-beta-D-heptose 1-phosphate adenosyltransferase